MAKFVKLNNDGSHDEQSRTIEITRSAMAQFYCDDDDSGYVVEAGRDTAFGVRYFHATKTMEYTGQNIAKNEIPSDFNEYGRGVVKWDGHNWRHEILETAQPNQGEEWAEIEEKSVFAVCDFEDKDRENPIIDTFPTREAAEKFAAEWSADYGHCTIKEMSEENAFEYQERGHKAFSESN